MSKNTGASPEQLTFQNDSESKYKRSKRAININPFGLFFTREQRLRYEFAPLREDVHRAMTSQLIERRKIGPTPTPEEVAMGFLNEEIEPQVRNAVFTFNRKGYKTISSGFSGASSPEHQTIEGHFILDDDTKSRLTAMGVEITTTPWWKWQMNESIGPTNTPAEKQILTTVRFKSQDADLHRQCPEPLALLSACMVKMKNCGALSSLEPTLYLEHRRQLVGSC